MEMKLYCLTNMYCQGVQAGIQAFHAGVKLIKEYEGTAFSTIIDEWYYDHETIVVLNAGGHDKLNSYYDDLCKQGKVPFAKFNEAGLNDATTCVAVLCTSEMVEDMSVMRMNLPAGDQLMQVKYGALFNTLKAISTMRTV
ncbi:hypothetical protein ACSGOQ_005241 [Escherichia coli]|nr:hypothetical protein [Escherichia coli]